MEQLKGTTIVAVKRVPWRMRLRSATDLKPSLKCTAAR